MNVVNEICERKLIAIVRGIEKSAMIKTAKALLDGGINAIEITFNQAALNPIEGTYEAIKAVVDAFGDRMLVGAGTVLTLEQADAAKEAGALFALAPSTDVSVIKRMKDNGLVAVPGAFTPTEIMNAYNAGADIVKLFPASVLGYDYIKALTGPIPHVPLMAVGGVDEKNVSKFLSLGFCSCGIGSSLVRRDLIEKGCFEELTALSRLYSSQVVRN